MTVDPGLNGTGYAVWRETERSDLVLPVRVGVWEPAHDLKTDTDKARSLYGKLSLWYGIEHCTDVYVEQPRFEDSARGNAAVRSGNFEKLCLAAATACNVAWSSGVGGHADWVSINRWKGNLPKDVVKRRIVKRYKSVGLEDGLDRLEVRTHAWDAVGIGLYVKGHFG